jgi:predicted Zn finger-like uncharacterized protein
MRLICSNCDAQYEVDDNAIPDEGRDVQCSNCGHAWFQLSPAVEAERLAEEHLFDAPEVEPLDEADDLPPEAFEPPAPLPRRSIDDNVMSVLREEAEREVAARRAEEARPLETQEELGLEAAGAAAPSPAARRIAQMKGIDPDAPPPPSRQKPATRGELLPDIEEINSTLRPSAERVDLDPAYAADKTLAANRAGFRSGFILMMALAVAAATVYVMAPRIAQQIPGAAPAMETYVQGVDALRLWLDGLMQRAIAALQGSAG